MNYGGAYYDAAYATPPVAKDVMEHIMLLKWYGETKLAERRLTLLALHADDPQWIKDREEEWMNEKEYWNGYYGGRDDGYKKAGYGWSID